MYIKWAHGPISFWLKVAYTKCLGYFIFSNHKNMCLLSFSPWLGWSFPDKEPNSPKLWLASLLAQEYI